LSISPIPESNLKLSLMSLGGRPHPTFWTNCNRSRRFFIAALALSAMDLDAYCMKACLWGGFVG